MFSLDDIEKGFKAQEFFLEYQPTISLRDRKCVGAEALIRWRRDGAVIGPLEFIPQTENSPLSGLLTCWVIDTIGAELGDWIQNKEGIHIGFNVPPEILGRGGLSYAFHISKLKLVLDKLLLEVTERGVPDGLGVEGLNRATSHGMLIALDDVDVNATNLYVLARIHSSIVKIDKPFVDSILEDDWSPASLERIAALVRSGTLHAIAEGVSDIRQVEILKNAGIQMAQGWHFSPSLPASDFKAYYERHR